MLLKCGFILIGRLVCGYSFLIGYEDGSIIDQPKLLLPQISELTTLICSFLSEFLNRFLQLEK